MPDMYRTSILWSDNAFLPSTQRQASVAETPWFAVNFLSMGRLIKYVNADTVSYYIRSNQGSPVKNIMLLTLDLEAAL